MSAEIDEYPSLHFQDVRKNQCRGRTHGRTDVKKFAGVYNYGAIQLQQHTNGIQKNV